MGIRIFTTFVLLFLVTFVNAQDCGILVAPTNGIIDVPTTTTASVAIYTCDSGYTMQGNPTRTCQGDDTWSGTAPTCAIQDCGILVAPTNGIIDVPTTTLASVATYTCDAGYTMQGNPTRTCQVDGTWSGTEPTCAIQDCGILVAPTNGIIDVPTTTLASVATYTCDAGHTMQGNPTRTCQVDGTWGGTAPTCAIQDCGSLDNPTDGAVDVSNGTTYLATATYSCDAGFDVLGGTSRTCKLDGTWTSTGPLCRIKDCGILINPSSGLVAIQDGTEYGDSATYTCNGGFTLEGSISRSCTANGTWSDSAPVCSIKDCGSPSVVTNGQYAFTTTTYGSTATYTCNANYGIVGSSTILCLAAGSWDSNTPTCKIDCGDLSTPINGTISAPSVTIEGQIATYTCNSGYALSGSETRTCEASGSWSGTDPTCILDCGLLVAPNNGIIDIPMTTLASVATFTCDAGYTMQGNPTRTCQVDDTWSGTTPTCAIEDCGFLANPTDGAVDVSSGTTYLATATYSCDDGFDVSGGTSRTCNADGTWSLTAPTCQIKDCGSLVNPSSGLVVTNDGTEYGDIATYTCNVGYTLVGSSSRPCTADGTWSESTPFCSIKDCGSPSVVSNGQYAIPTTTYGSTATYTCNVNYSIVGSSTILCLATGSWDSNTPTCIVDCGGLFNPTNGAVAAPSATTEGQNATYTCNSGYVIFGSETRTCEASGSWSGTAPTCTFDCGTLVAPTNGLVDIPTTTTSSVATYTCDAGHTMQGNPTRTCLSDDTWSGTAPTCAIEDCGSLTNPTDGAVDISSGTTYLATATYSCNAGFDVTGGTSRTCNAGGTWSSTAPTCQNKDCGSLVNPSSGLVVTNDGTEYGDSATYTCNVGYTLVGSSSRLCSIDGTWSDSAPVCSIKDCGILVNPNSGLVVTNDGTEYGDIATYTCNVGYTLVGSSLRSCTADGTWSDSAPVCSIKDCGSLANPTDGAVDVSSGTTYLATAAYSCNAGFDVSGGTSRTCNAGGTWSSTAPTCQNKDCGSLVNPSSGLVVTNDGTEYGDSATYTCNVGYTLVGSSSRPCSIDGTWSDSAPVCSIKDCGILVNPNSGLVVTNDGTEYGDIATYTCNVGYTLVGSSLRSCTSDGTWSDSAPVCSIKDCGSLVNPSSGLVVTNGGTEYGDNATYTCNLGYTLVGSIASSCTADGTWSDSAPVCSIKDCGSPSVVTNGQYAISTTTYGSTATYTCDANYGIVGSSTILCLAAGSWDSNTPTCIVDCGTPSNITGGSVIYPGGTAVTAEATYTCDSGYTQSGGATVTCQADASWSTSPSCSINCGGLYNPTNGAVAAPSVMTEGQIATYTCNSGYALSGSEPRTCEASGSWTGTAPTCTSGCSEPDPPLNGQVNISDGFTSGSVVTYSCDTGYALVGSTSRVCLMDTTWNGQTPTCNKECSVLADVKDGTVDMSRGNWATSVATYICDKNFALVGQSTRTCQSAGLWSGVEPSCRFAMLPNILIAFGVLFMVLFIVDIVVLGIWLYQKINKPKKDEDEENEDDDPEEKVEEKKAKFLPFMVERPDEGMMHSPPSFMNVENRKSKYSKIAPEIIEDSEVLMRNTGHPRPKKPPFSLKVEKLDRLTFMKTPRDKKKSPGREKTFESSTLGLVNDRFRPDMIPAAPEPSSFVPPKESKQVNLADELYNGNSDYSK